VLVILRARLELEVALALTEHGHVDRDKDGLCAERERLLELLLGERLVGRDVELPREVLLGLLDGEDLVDRAARARRDDLQDVVRCDASDDVLLAVRVTETSETRGSDEDGERRLRGGAVVSDARTGAHEDKDDEGGETHRDAAEGRRCVDVAHLAKDAGAEADPLPGLSLVSQRCRTVEALVQV